MSNSAKTVLWLGLFMILAGIIRNWSLFSATIFGSGSSQIFGAGGSGVNISHGIAPINGKCPTGYTRAYGKCWSPATNPIPPTSSSA